MSAPFPKVWPEKDKPIMLPSPLNSNLLVRVLRIQEIWIQFPHPWAVWLGLLCTHRALLSAHVCRKVDAPRHGRFMYSRSGSSGRVRSALGCLNWTHVNWRSWASVWSSTHYSDSHNLLLAPSLLWMLLKRWQGRGQRPDTLFQQGQPVPSCCSSQKPFNFLPCDNAARTTFRARKCQQSKRFSWQIRAAGRHVCAGACSVPILCILLSFHTAFHTDIPHARPYSKHAK